MKKVLCVAAGVALVTASGAFAATTLTITMTASETSVNPGDPFDYDIRGVLSGDASEGLALWGADVTFTTNGQPTDVGAQMTEGASMGSFVKPDGLTNPDGYGGTVSGNVLLQVGGGQNTINNDSSIAPYPTGAVVTDIGDVEVILAQGTYTTTAGQEGDIVRVEAGNCFANVIDAGETGPVFAVSAATLDCTAAFVEVEVSAAGLPECFAADVNCDGNVNAGDLTVVRAPANWLTTCAGAGDSRADVNRDGNVNAGDLTVIRAPANWLTTGHDTPPLCDCIAVCP